MGGIHGCAVDGVAAGRVAAVGPIDHVFGQVQIDVDRLGQVVVQHFYIGAIGGRLTVGDFQVGAAQAAFIGVTAAFLRPIDLASADVNSDANAPVFGVGAGGVTLAGFDQGHDMRAVQVGAHDAHAFAVGPVEFAVHQL